MPTRWETYPIKFEGGLTTNLGRIEQGIQAPGSATILQNFEPDVQGGYTRILGFSKFSPNSISGTGIVLGVVALSATEVLALRSGTYWYSTGTTWTSKLVAASSAATRIRFDSFNFNGTRKTVIVDGVNHPAFFDHSTKTMSVSATTHPDIPGSSYVRVFKNHVFYAKGTMLNFSVPYQEDNFSTGSGAGAINIGEVITGLAVFRDQLIVFCQNKIFRIAGNTSADFVLQSITDNTGCLNGDTIQEVGGDIMYLGPDGVRHLSASERENDFGLVRASEKIQRQISDTVSTNAVYASVTIPSKNQYRLFAYRTTTPRQNSVAYLATKYSNQTVDNVSWATIKGMKVYAVDKYQDRDIELIVFCSENDFVYKMESTTGFDGEDIEAIFETPYMPISDPKIRKTIYKHTLYAKSGGDFSVRVNLKFDYGQSNSVNPPQFQVSGTTTSSIYGSPTALYGAAVYGARDEEQYYSNVIGSGFTVAIRYYDNSQRAPFNLNFAVLEYRQNERR